MSCSLSNIIKEIQINGQTGVILMLVLSERDSVNAGCAEKLVVRSNYLVILKRSRLSATGYTSSREGFQCCLELLHVPTGLFERPRKVPKPSLIYTEVVTTFSGRRANRNAIAFWTKFQVVYEFVNLANEFDTLIS